MKNKKIMVSMLSALVFVLSFTLIKNIDSTAAADDNICLRYILNYEADNSDVVQATFKNQVATANIPTPSLRGMEFVGWYYEDENLSKKIPSTVVTIGDFNDFFRQKYSCGTVVQIYAGHRINSSSRIVNTNTTCGNYLRYTWYFTASNYSDSGGLLNENSPMPTPDLSDGRELIGLYYDANYTKPINVTKILEMDRYQCGTPVVNDEIDGCMKLICGVHAKTTMGYYSVVFNGNTNTGGSMSNLRAEIGILTALTNNGYTKTGYDFNGWALSTSGEVKYRNQDEIFNLGDKNSTVTLYAKWTAKTFTVKYNNNGGTGSMSNSSYTYGTSTKLRPNAFNRDGYRFTGWATSSSGEVVYTDQFDTKAVLPSSNILTLYAHWEPLVSTVTYNNNGGTGTMNNSTHTYGVSSALSTNTFVREGYTFAGWSTTKTGSANYVNNQNVSSISGNITLYAVWNPITYQIKYNNNDGVGTMENSSHQYGVTKELTQNTFTKEGYTFAGWSTTKTGNVEYTNKQPVNNVTTEAKTIELFAVWSPVSYTVSYIANYGTGTMTQSIFEYGKTEALKKNTITRKGYTFAGWSTNLTDIEYEDEERVLNLLSTSGNVNLYTMWKPITYQIKYNNNDGVGTMENSTHTFDIPSNLSINRFTREGYTFVGWSNASDGKLKYLGSGIVLNLSETQDSIVDLYAMWRSNTITCPATNICRNLIYNINGGNPLNNTTYCEGTDTILEIPNRNGFNFGGWYIDSSLTTTITNGRISSIPSEPIVDDNGCITGFKDINLYARWEEAPNVCNEVPKCFNVSFESNGGSSISNYKICDPANNSDNNKDLPVPTKEGYTFAGWYRDSILLSSVTKESLNKLPYVEIKDKDCITAYQDLLLYAKWNKVSLVNLTGRLVDKNGNGLVGYKIELHSEPKSTITGENGYFKFENIENGNHTLSVYSDNNTLLSKDSIILDSDNTTNINSNIIGYKYANNNTMDVLVEYNNEKIDLKLPTNVDNPISPIPSPDPTPAPPSIPTDNPNTADYNVIIIWLISLCGAILFIKRRRTSK